MKFSQLLSQNPETVAAGAALWTHKGHIEGNKMVWLSGSGLRLTSGSTYIPSLGYAIDAPTDIDKTGLSLAPSTWYHLYRYVNAGVPDFEVVTTAPATPYSGTARSKTGDTSRRYVGSALTDGSGNIWNFLQTGTEIQYQENLGNAPFGVGSGLMQTTATDVALSSVVPLTSRLATLRVAADSTAALRLTNSETSASFIAFLAASSTSVFNFPTNSSQVIRYFNASAPSFGAAIAVFGYTYER